MNLRPNTGRRTEDIPVENLSERKIRIFLAVMFFIQALLTSQPFMHHVDAETNTLEGYITVLDFIVQADGIAGNNIAMAIYGVILIALPVTAFFFCLFDKRSRVKYLLSGLCSVICAIVITFTVGTSISYGAVITLIINVVTLFMTMQGLQATAIRMKGGVR